MLETLTTEELREADGLLENIKEALLLQRQKNARALIRRLWEAWLPKLRGVFEDWEISVMRKIGKVRLEDLSLPAEVVRNYELALGDLPTRNKLARKYYNEKPKTLKSLQAEYAVRIAGLVSLSQRQKERLTQGIEGIEPVKKAARHPGALAPAVAVSVDPNPLQEILGEQLEVGIIEGGQFTYRERGEKPSFFALKDPKSIKWISDQSFLFAEHTASRFTAQSHWRFIKRGLDEGEGIPQIRRAIKGEFEKLTTYQAERIARTATAQAVEHGRHQGMSELGIKRVEVVNGPNPCDECIELAGRGPMNIEDARGLLPVHANCTCDLVAVE